MRTTHQQELGNLKAELDALAAYLSSDKFNDGYASTRDVLVRLEQLRQRASDASEDGSFCSECGCTLQFDLSENSELRRVCGDCRSKLNTYMVVNCKDGSAWVGVV